MFLQHALGSARFCRGGVEGKQEASLGSIQMVARGASVIEVIKLGQDKRENEVYLR